MGNRSPASKLSTKDLLRLALVALSPFLLLGLLFLWVQMALGHL
jgi:hypothetical protein